MPASPGNTILDSPSNGPLYNPNPDGYCGDEDNGQTSAWYVFSAMGFYPVCPGTPQYVFGTLLFKKMTVKLQNGKQLIINASSNGKESYYVQCIQLNGKAHTKNWMSHFDLQKGGTLLFDLKKNPNRKRGSTKESFPYSFSTQQEAHKNSL